MYSVLLDTKQRSIVLTQQVTSGSKLESVSFVVNSGTVTQNPHSDICENLSTRINSSDSVHHEELYTDPWTINSGQHIVCKKAGAGGQQW